MTGWTPPAPVATTETLPYWQAARDGRLILRRCTACGKPHFYPRAICPFCQSDAVEWVEASGRGTIYSFSHMQAGQPPYVMALVTLAEGPTMMTNIVDTDPATLAIGDAVQVAFQPSEGDYPYPVFRKP